LKSGTVKKRLEKVAILIDYTGDFPIIQHDGITTELTNRLVEYSHVISQSGNSCKPSSWVFYEISVCEQYFYLLADVSIFSRMVNSVLA
jgi:hypothetical protein